MYYPFHIPLTASNFVGHKAFFLIPVRGAIFPLTVQSAMPSPNMAKLISLTKIENEAELCRMSSYVAFSIHTSSPAWISFTYSMTILAI